MARSGSDHACADYLARKRWPGGFVCPHCGSRKAWHLEARPWILEASGVVLRYPAGNSAIEQRLTRFDAHMRDVWGMADCTRRKRCRPVGGFSCRAFRRAADLPGDNQGCIHTPLRPWRRRRPVTVAAIGAIMSCCLRFRSMSGDRESELKAAIARVVHWRLASWPEVLTDTGIDELLSSFAQSFPIRLRAKCPTKNETARLGGKWRNWCSYCKSDRQAMPKFHALPWPNASRSWVTGPGRPPVEMSVQHNAAAIGQSGTKAGTPMLEPVTARDLDADRRRKRLKYQLPLGLISVSGSQQDPLRSAKALFFHRSSLRA